MLQSDQDEWFTAAVTRYERPLVAYARQYVSELEAARDVVQEVFVKLHAALNQPHPVGKGDSKENDKQDDLKARVAQWLFVVCRNACIDHQRRHAVSRTEHPMDLAARPSPAAAPEAALEQRESAAQVLAALARLPARQQEVLRLKFHHGLSYADIATVTRLSVSNVGFIMSTGLAALRQHLAPQALVPAHAHESSLS